MCCCKFPPSVGLAIYILFSVLVGFYLRQVKSIHLIQPEYHVGNSEDYNDSYIRDYRFDVEFKRLDKLGKKFSSNVYINFTIYENVEITLKEKPASDSTSATSKTYINNRSFCEIMDYYVHNRNGEPAQKKVSLCPAQAGFYEIYGNHSKFSDLAVSSETGGHKTFLVELIRHAEKIACKQFQFINRSVENRPWPENGLYEEKLTVFSL